MPRRRSAETMEKDQRAYDLHRRGITWRAICSELGYRSTASAQEAVGRAARDNASDPLEQAEARQAALDRLQDYRRAMQRILAARHYKSTESGKTVAQEYRDKVINGHYSENDYERAAQYGRTPAQYQAEITRDIAQRGMINPARASYGTLDEGFHRYVAMRQLGMRSMPVKWDGG